MTPVDRVAVVIPVHNEEEHLGRALAGVEAAASTLRQVHPCIDVRVLVVLDSCTDGSAAIASAYTARNTCFSVHEVAFRSVGRSRRAGNWQALGAGADASPGAGAGLWLANTDADSVVPDNWLVGQLELAAAGADAVLGSVEVDPAGMAPELLSRWQSMHSFGEDHPHVFGANLGVRGSAYLVAGGFPRHLSHEDRVLAGRLRDHGFDVRATDTIRVRTSGRTQARAPKGFGAYLRTLGMEIALAPEA
ncbi:glycosyltransferase [Arthrobacter sp. OY3WO11]|uniref:glycosyltransferase n=1 Tax=Arthrobacter sp. OY3WO11 TaxID=1835723 RepID=UPI0007CF0183|nr:glycosyltransferase [Arthrobacter sp. OY3WO11]OAE00544.1 glycosyl transferase [Arthrobacter sp. OY3WO11]